MTSSGSPFAVNVMHIVNLTRTEHETSQGPSKVGEGWGREDCTQNGGYARWKLSK